MAIQNDDLLVAYRPASEQHFKVSVGNFLPIGTEDGQTLKWNATNSQWEPASIDGGEYAT